MRVVAEAVDVEQEEEGGPHVERREPREEDEAEARVRKQEPRGALDEAVEARGEPRSRRPE